jgi:hypothetical protein
LHNNARPHTAAHTGNILQNLKFEVLDDAAYSPDLARSDIHMFGPLGGSQGRRFADDEVKEAVHDWLRIQPNLFFPVA